MSKAVNSFALLGDEEDEDVTVLVEHITKKVEFAATKAAEVVVSKKQPPLNQFLQVSSENSKRHVGRDHGPTNGRFGRRKEDQFSNKQNTRNGNGYGQGCEGSGVGREYSNKNRIVDEKNMNEDVSDGWQVVRRTPVRGYVENMNKNLSKQRPFRNGNAGAVRRGYGGGNRRGSRDVMDYASRQLLNNIDVKEKLEINQIKENVDNVDVNAVNIESSNSVSEGNAAPVTEESIEVSAEDKKPEESVKAAKPVKKIEKEDENLMTLEEYEKVLAEKRNALESLKMEERKVPADKGLEAMQLLAKKKEDALLNPEASKLKKKDSLEKDDKSRKTVSINEFLKPADGEIFVYRRPGRGRGRGGVSGDFRKGDRSEQQGFRNRNRPSHQQGESMNKDNELVEQIGFRSKDYPKEGRKATNSPIVRIEDQGQFPVLLQGTAPAV